MNDREAVLFDIDGTLLDSTEFFYRAYEYTFQISGLPAISRDEVSFIVGQGSPLKECYRYFSPAEDTSKLCEIHRSFQLHHLNLSIPFTHTRATLQRLQMAGVKMAAVSTRSRLNLIRTLETSGIISYFDVILSGDDVLNHKPDPEPLFKALNLIGVEPKRAIMVGDTEADILAGKNAGTKTVGVSYGFQGAKIVESHPDFIIDSIERVIPIILFDSDRTQNH